MDKAINLTYDEYHAFCGAILAVITFVICVVQLCTDKETSTFDLLLACMGGPLAMFAFGPVLLLLILGVSPFALIWYIIYKIRGK